MERKTNFALIGVSAAGVVHGDWGIKRDVRSRRPETELAHGTVLTMTREPNNEYDKKAIMLSANGGKLGYIPSTIAAWMSNLIDNGYEMYATVEAVDIRNHQVLITVMMGKQEQATGT